MFQKVMFLVVFIIFGFLSNSNGWTVVDQPQDEETRALTTAGYLLSGGQFDEYDRLRNQWRSHEQFPHKWLFLDSEELFLQGNRKEAIDLLSQHTLVGKEEIDRLVRLAAFHVVENPAEAWNCLNEACLKNPQNPDLHTFKASLLESNHKNTEAEKEYLLAIQKYPQEPYFKEQLADFYMRDSQHSKALQVLTDGMKGISPSGAIWLKAFFLSRVAKKTDPLDHSLIVPSDSLNPLVSYVYSLRPDEFWNEEKFDNISGRNRFLYNQQELFWLRLIAALKDKREGLALQILENDSFQFSSWAPEVEQSLKNILAYRQQFLLESSEGQSSSAPIKVVFSSDMLLDEKKFLAMLAVSVPPEFHDMMLSEEAFALPFLAFGWHEAALQLHVLDLIPDHFPEWVTCCLVKAIAANRGVEAAFSFSDNHPPMPRRSLLAAHLALDSGDIKTAFETLLPIYHDKNDIGVEATLLITPFFLANDNVTAAKEAILNQPSLANEVVARELLARAFFLEGDTDTAYRLYLSLEGRSIEAKSFLAHKAFSDKDWGRARQLTLELLEVYPNSRALQENLKSLEVTIRR